MTNPKPKLLFAGTPDIAATILEALLPDYDIVAVLTQPDRPKGRGRKLQPSPVKVLAQTNQLPIHQPTQLKDGSMNEILAAYQADMMIVVAYGMLLPQSVLDIPKQGCLNIHTSLLPRWRGAAPLTHAILAGDSETGVSLMKMTAGLDTGPIYAQHAFKLEAQDTTETLLSRCATIAATFLKEQLPNILSGQTTATEQDDTLANYAHKIAKDHAHINWHQPAIKIDAMIRAYNPWPVCFNAIDDTRFRIWQAEIVASSNDAEPGTVLELDKKGILVSTETTDVLLKHIQLPGGKALPVSALLNNPNHPFAVGAKLV